MPVPFLGEIRPWAAMSPPKGWRACNGDLLQVSDYPELFSLVGRFYGGDGETTFALPDLQGRVPVHMSEALIIGAQAGVERVTLRTDELPTHQHLLQGSTLPGSRSGVANNVPASLPVVAQVHAYGTREPIHTIDPDSIANAGGDGAHENMQQFLVVGYIIAMTGKIPTRESEEAS
ncbi:MAG TPA: tail fiber protein [Marmoricola sp.]|jgi:microcystin-dependent protein|nr:tail fiber protein [Marmoricola sp.]